MRKSIKKDIKDFIERGDFTTKVQIFFSLKTAGDDFDNREKNYTFTNLNPQTIKAYVREPSASSLVYRELGTVGIGAVEIICLDKYYEWFKNCNKLVIDGIEYNVYKTAIGSRSMVQKRAGGTLRILAQKV